MSQPPTYNRTTSFANLQAISPTAPPPGNLMDVEFNNVKATLDQTLANLKLLQRDDTALANGSVGLAQLSTGLTIGFTAPTSWATATAYIASPASTVFNGGKFYSCLASHTSGTFATDLALGKWVLIADLTSIPLVNASQISVVANGGLVSSDVQTSLNAIDAGKAAFSHTHPSSAISDSTAAGRAILTAANAAAQRALFGLGTMSAENIGPGLQDDGASNVRVVFTTVADSSNQAVTSTFHLNQRAATGALTYTLPRANTLFNGFAFWVNALTGPITFALNAADAFAGGVTGTSMVIPPGTQAYISTDAQNSGTWFVVLASSVSLNAPFNLQINATVAANALTIAVKDRNGNDPTPASPVLVSFRDPTVANGDPVARAITAALSITIPSTATIGTVSGQTGRLWVGLFDNAGTPVLGVYNALNSTGPSIVSWDETSVASGIAVVGGSNSTQTWYTNGTIASKSFRILGYIEFTEGTAGTWASAPSQVQLFGPGVKKPGDVVQEITAIISASDSTASATFVAFANNKIAIAPKSAANMVRVESLGTIAGVFTPWASGGAGVNIIFSRGTTSNAGLIGQTTLLNLNMNSGTGNPSGIITASLPLIAYDLPNTATAQTYSIQGKVSSLSSGTLTYGGTSYIGAKEIQA